MQEELMVNIDAFEASEEDYDSLKEAVIRLSNASEEQFENIKKEKWYNRVFDMITFSQKGKKRLAEQVSTVAQAQQILIELLLRLSSNDANISKLVMDCMNDIKRIQEQNIYLLSKINKLENISLGIKCDTDISLLSEKNKQLLSGCLYYISEQNSNGSEEQQRFANMVLKYINSDVQMDNPIVAICNVDNESKKKILACCMEYMFLYNCQIESVDGFQNFIEEFDFGKKTIQTISKQIQSLYNLRGLDGFYDKYRKENFQEIDETFSVEFLEDIELENEEIEMQDCFISSILQVKVGDIKRYEYKKIHISAYINCEGTLEFDHCIIYYNESTDGDEITLAENANLIMKNSIVICKGFDETTFIVGKRNNGIEISNCTFVDCSFFLELNSGSKFILERCELKNCFQEFLTLGMNDDALSEISDNIFTEDGVADFNLPKDKSIFWYSMALMDIKYMNMKSDKCLIHGNVFVENVNFKRTGREEKDDDNEMKYINSNCANVYNCTFIGASKCVTAIRIVDCKFQDCKHVVNTESWFDANENALIDNCSFEHCTDVLELEDNSTVSNCQFVSCYNRIISPKSSWGGITVEFCEFTNVKYQMDNSTWSSVIRNNILGGASCLTFERAKESKGRFNTLRKCIFNGAELNDGFLIAATATEKPSGVVTYIEECDFKNCSTKRSSGNIIKEYIKYDTLFKKDQDFHANIVSDCRGLERINKEAAETDNVEVKTQNTSGKNIGSALAVAEGAAIVAVGGPVALGVAAGIITIAKRK